MNIIDKIITIFAPPAPIDPLPSNQIDREYRKQRIRIFLGIFIGYGAAYLVRNNISMAIPHLIKEGIYNETQLGLLMTAISLAYGISKFIMGNLSDRSNPRYFLALGLLVPTLIAYVLGCTSWAYGNLAILIFLMILIGWFQGMTYPPCVRVLAHWYTVKERSLTMTVWNLSHNIGGSLVGPLATLGMLWFGTWKGLFTLPAIIVSATVLLVIFWVRDTPQSLGLPPIEEYHGGKISNHSPSILTIEKELSSKEIFVKHILKNRAVWFLALANIFVYFVRYGVLNWAPLYLQQVKGFDFKGQGLAYFIFEFSGIFSILLCGYLSSRYFKSRRVPVIVVSMILVTFAVLGYWLNPPGNIFIDDILLAAIGFLIYGPVVFIGMQAVDVVDKKAVGTATGLTGLFGYMIGTTGANLLLGSVVHHYGWNMGFYLLIAASVLSVGCLIPIWNAGGEK